MRTQLCIGVFVFAIVSVANSRSEANENIRWALTFRASFDAGTEAAFALGEKRHAPAINRRAEAKPGYLP